MAGYCGAPLVQMLGIRPGHRVALVDAPDDFAKTLGKLPEGVVLAWGTPTAKQSPDGVVWFLSRRSELERRLPVLRARMLPAASLRLCWPRKTSGVENVIRGVALPTGLVDNKVCEHRPSAKGVGAPKRRTSA